MNTLVQTIEHSSNPKPISTAMLNITLDQLNTLKGNIANNAENPTRYSTCETLAARVWRCMCMARDLSEDQPTKLYIATDGQSRLHPLLPHA